MNIDVTDRGPGTTGISPEQRNPRTLEQAAEQFEHVLVKQMVSTMTKGMFDNSLAGDDGPQWLGAYSEMQGDVLASELAKQLTESGRLGIAELLMKKWQARVEGPDEAPAAPSFNTDDIKVIDPPAPEPRDIINTLNAS